MLITHKKNTIHLKVMILVLFLCFFFFMNGNVHESRFSEMFP